MARSFLRHTGITAVLAATVIAAGCSHDTTEAGAQPAPSTHAAAQRTTTAPGFSPADVMFAQMVVPHHGQGITLAGMAVQRSTNPQIKTLAAAIVVTQRDEAARVAGWLRHWKQPGTAPKDSHEAHGGMPTTSPHVIAQLQKATGPQFDKLFLGAMIAHQDDAIQIARQELGQGTNAQARALAASIEKSRKAQIDMMIQMMDKKS